MTVARVNLPPQGQSLILPHPQPRTHHHLLGLVPVLVPVAPVVTAIPVVMKAPAHQHETLFIIIMCLLLSPPLFSTSTKHNVSGVTVQWLAKLQTT